MKLKPDFIFESSWEVCNKVGGIYTVLATRANTMQKLFPDKVVFIGPDLGKHSNTTFTEDSGIMTEWQAVAAQAGIKCRVGRWNIPGQPIAILLNSQQYYVRKNEIYLHLWEDYGVDSLHAYGDYDEASMFAYAVARLVENIHNNFLNGQRVIFHANEWMLGVALLYLHRYVPQVATIFTTHATTVGRSIAGNGKDLYSYLPGYYGNQMARELNVDSKHSVEQKAAQNADCFTTVSAITARECTQLLERRPDELLLNGFEDDFVPAAKDFGAKRWMARKQLLDVADCLTGGHQPEDTLIVSTSGRYEFRNKGLDVFVDAMARLRALLPAGKQVLAFVNVPAWVASPREDLADRMSGKQPRGAALACPYLTHWLHNMETDRMLQMLKRHGFHNRPEDNVKVIFVPCYLDGEDGIINKHYYDIVLGNDLCIYPSYYEPWGYTPLEAIAFSVPCVTTDLAGFGIWAREELNAVATIENGVEVIHRSDTNYHEVAEQVAQTVSRYAQLPETEKEGARKKARQLSKKALWKHFFAAYERAYDHALKNAKKRNNI